MPTNPPQPDPPHPEPNPDPDHLATLFEAAGLLGHAPHWVPRNGYATPTRDVLTAVESGLRSLRERSADAPAPHLGNQGADG